LFRIISKIICKLWPAFLFFWLAGAIFLHNNTRPFKEVSSDDPSGFLPAQSDSNLANKLVAEGFPKENASSSAVIIANSKKELTEQDFAYIEKLSDWLESEEAPEVIMKVTSIKTEPYLRERLISQDKRAVITKIDLSTIFVAPDTKEAVDEVADHIFITRPSHLDFAFTGDAAHGHDYTASLHESLHRTTACTIIFLLFILIVIYRSPIAWIIPLATIGTAFVVAISVISFLAEHYFKIPMIVEIFMVVVLFGAGTDYCFFLISRYREELGKGLRHREAVETALASVGGAIAASASTEIIGLGMMIFAVFGSFKNTGPMVAIGLVVTFFAAITFTPALLMIFGPIIIWPATRERLDITRRRGGVWNIVARAVTRYPGVILFLVLLGCAPLAYIGWRMKPSYTLKGELPKVSEAKRGREILKKHFKESEIMPTKIVFRSKENLWSPGAIDAVYQLTNMLSLQPNITEVRSATSPLGRKSQGIERALLVSRIKGYEQGAAEILAGFKKLDEGLALAYESVENYRAVLKQKASQKLFGVIKAGAKSYEEAAERLEQLSSGLGDMRKGVGKLEAGVKEIKDRLHRLSSDEEMSFLSKHLILSMAEIEAHPDLKKGMEKYISEDGYIGKLEAHIKYEPYSTQALDTIEEMKKLLSQYRPFWSVNVEEGFHLVGATARINDVRLVTRSDFRLIMILILSAIFIILAMMLRKAVAPIYLTATMLLSYFVTMGIAVLVFVTYGGVESLDWKVEFFMFVLLIAIGIDYNIFLMSRVKEEAKKHDTYTAVRHAVAYTGGAISSCGVIMAGTFASLMTSPLGVMVQLGFAISCGMLLDTFLVRPIIVPSIAVLLDRWKIKVKYERHKKNNI